MLFLLLITTFRFVLRIIAFSKQINNLICFEAVDNSVLTMVCEVAPPPRLERGTCGLTVRRSNQLS